jgi:hypothetical protein
VNREEPMLESAVEGIGSRGIVVQGPRGRHVVRSIVKESTTVEGERPVSSVRTCLNSPRTPRVAQFDSAVQTGRCTSAKAK